MSTGALYPPPWTELAVCVEVDPEIFFPVKGDPSEQARALCRSCEARLDCLAFAIRHHPQHGVWGGFSEYRRAAVAREHLAGRPLRDIIADDDAAFYDAQERSALLAAAARERAREYQRARSAAARAAVATTAPQSREQAA